jgi:two-component system, chemotaxis family, protein-glutamate methylesterase/glutaminase
LTEVAKGAEVIRVLIVDDSLVAREFLQHILSSEPDIQVVGLARDGEEAVRLVTKIKPDVVTMDIHMPKMDGYQAIRKIMETHPVPIIIVSSSWDPKEVSKTFQAMEAGAVAALAKPQGIGHPDHESAARELVQTVKLMSEVKVVRRWARPSRGPAAPGPQPRLAGRPKPAPVSLIALGTSTGGPPVLQTILSRLPKDLPAPIVIVQHIARGFVQGLLEWLEQTTGLPMHLAAQGERLLPGHVYFAPDGHHLGVEADGCAMLSTAPPENGLRPSVSFLFRSVARNFGNRAVGVLLTGMGRDGAEELGLMREEGAVTCAQDQASSVVHGMPGEAIKLGAAVHVLPPEAIADLLKELSGK